LFADQAGLQNRPDFFNRMKRKAESRKHEALTAENAKNTKEGPRDHGPQDRFALSLPAIALAQADAFSAVKKTTAGRQRLRRGRPRLLNSSNPPTPTAADPNRPNENPMTGNGKIARLPRAIRDELNRRMDDGQTGKELLPWLNGLPEVQKLLAEQFAGRPIIKQNLCEWRAGGHRAWQARQETLTQARELAGDAEELASATDTAGRIGSEGRATRVPNPQSPEPRTQNPDVRPPIPDARVKLGQTRSNQVKPKNPTNASYPCQRRITNIDQCLRDIPKILVGRLATGVSGKH
jgi:hypothetical protein